MNIKIEPGANVQITDKPIINVYGDMVQHKEVHIHPEETTTKRKPHTGTPHSGTDPLCGNERLDVCNESFADRVKAIMRKAATKNGQRIETTAKGHAGAYIYHIHAEAFCKAMDDLVNSYGQKLKEFLGGSMNCVQVTKVCFFIGQTISRQIINDSQLQLADIFFAFEKYYKLSTVQSRLSVKSCTDEESVLLGTFEGLLKKHTA